MIWIRDTAIYRANGCALRFFMKAITFGAFAANDVIKFVRNRFLAFIGIIITSSG